MPRTLTLPWSKVSAGMTVELKGAPWVVLKAKPKGKLVRVKIEHDGESFTSEVKAKAEVAIWRKPETTPTPRRRDASTSSQRASTSDEWAISTEVPEITKTAAWGNPKGEIERLLSETLDAKLVAVRLDRVDAHGAYFVPPVNPDTIASHLFIYHGLDGEQMIDYRKAREHELTHTQAEAEALLSWEVLSELHDTEHRNGRLGKVPHFHTDERPMK